MTKEEIWKDIEGYENLYQKSIIEELQELQNDYERYKGDNK